MHKSLCLLAVLNVAFAGTARAASNGMDMSMDDAMALASGQMLPYFHFTPGDNLWFQGWVPASAGAMVGACIALFLLGMVDRWISANWAMMELHWARRSHLIMRDQPRVIYKAADDGCACDPPTTLSAVSSITSVKGKLSQTTPPFIIVHDVVRSVLFVVQSAMHFVFMLAIMTCQLGFVFAIIIGLGVGETLFGRFVVHGEAFD